MRVISLRCVQNTAHTSSCSHTGWKGGEMYVEAARWRHCVKRARRDGDKRSGGSESLAIRAGRGSNQCVFCAVKCQMNPSVSVTSCSCRPWSYWNAPTVRSLYQFISSPAGKTDDTTSVFRPAGSLGYACVCVCVCVSFFFFHVEAFEPWISERCQTVNKIRKIGAALRHEIMEDVTDLARGAGGGM